MAKTLSKTEFIKDIKSQLKNLTKVGNVPLNLEYKYNPGDMTRMMNECMSDVKNIRGVHSIKTLKGSWCDTVMVYVKPCKEYNTLMKYLNKLNINFDFDEVRQDFVAGKRSSMDVKNQDLLCYKPRMCKMILDELREARATTAAKIKKESFKDTYWGDRFNSYGEDMECEWNGFIRYGFKLTLLTPSGRVRKNIFISVI